MARKQRSQHSTTGGKTIQLIASGDLRLAANQVCWPAQLEMENALAGAIRAEGRRVVRIPSRKPNSMGSSPRNAKGWKYSGNSIPTRP